MWEGQQWMLHLMSPPMTLMLASNKLHLVPISMAGCSASQSAALHSSDRHLSRPAEEVCYSCRVELKLHAQQRPLVPTAAASHKGLAQPACIFWVEGMGH